jgi:outer membrane protein OmpA-like peptidoglycan-associated protein
MMKIRNISLALAVAFASASAFAADAANTAAPQAPGIMAGQPERPIPKTPEAWIERMTDFTKNMSAFKDPRVFVPWSQAVTEPSFYTAAMNGMLDPGGWTKMFASMADPAAYQNAMMFADPNVWMRWAAASMDPQFYTALLTQFSDPGKMMRWAMSPMDPKLWNLPLQMMNPSLYMRWMLLPMDPKVWAMSMMPLNPNWYMSWAGAMMNPRSYGPTWGNWLNTPAPQTPQGAGGGFLPIDLSGLFGAFGMPNLAAPGAMPGSAGAAVPVPTPSIGIPFFGGAGNPYMQASAAPTQAAGAPAAVPGKMVLSADALFPIGKGDVGSLSAAGKKQLDAFADKVKATPNVKKIKVTGHADKSGKADRNMVLSRQRANSVKAYLVAKGIKAKMIQAVGAGDTKPVKECDMKMPTKDLAECLAPNRRVEVEIAE